MLGVGTSFPNRFSESQGLEPQFMLGSKITRPEPDCTKMKPLFRHKIGKPSSRDNADTLFRTFKMRKTDRSLFRRREEMIPHEPMAASSNSCLAGAVVDPVAQDKSGAVLVLEGSNGLEIEDYVAQVEINQPYGLPSGLHYEDYLKYPVCQLRWFNYKITANIGTDRNAFLPMLTVIDTGAGPNLIREGACPVKALETMDTSERIASLREASRHKLHTIGIVTLTVQVATKTSRVPFFVGRNLRTDALLGCSYSDEFVQAIMCIKRHIVLENGDIVPIQQRRALLPIKG